MKILILNTAFLGDVILTTPLVHRVFELFSKPEIHFLCIPGVKNVLENNPFINKIILYDKNKSQKNIGSIFLLKNELKKENYNLAIVPHRSLRSAALVWIAKIHRRIGYDTSAGWFLFTDRIKYIRDGRHEIDRILNLLDPFELQNHETFPEIYPDDTDRKKIDDIASMNSSFQSYSIAPGSVWPTKRWLPDRFTQVAKILAEKAPVYLIGGPEDFDLCETISRGTGSKALNVAGKLTPRQSAELIRRTHLLITNDSAPLHMAVAMKTPVLAIFGPTIPKFGFFPYGRGNQLVETIGLPCRPCSIHGGMECPIRTLQCMKDIPVEKVLNLISSFAG